MGNESSNDGNGVVRNRCSRWSSPSGWAFESVSEQLTGSAFDVDLGQATSSASALGEAPFSELELEPLRPFAQALDEAPFSASELGSLHPSESVLGRVLVSPELMQLKSTQT
jgi:hypothetical protein